MKSDGPACGARMPPPRGLVAYDLGGGAVLLVHDLPSGTPSFASHLTPAQREVVEHALAGMGDEEIARVTGRSRHTVSNLLRQAYRRLGVASRVELAALIPSGNLDARGRAAGAGKFARCVVAPRLRSFRA